MKFDHESLPDGKVKISAYDDDGTFLESRTFSKETVEFLSQAKSNEGISYPDGIWIPITDNKTSK